MKIQVYIFLFLFAASLTCFAQDTLRTGNPIVRIKPTDTISPVVVPGMIIGSDTLPYVDLYAVTVYPEVKFMSQEDRVNYQKLVYRVRKVYPYAKLAAKKLDEYRKVLDTIPTNRGRKQFIRKAQKQLEEQFEDEIKKLSFSQGKILIKLINRETGNSTYDIVRELRGGFNAFIWQSMAGLFGYDLKTFYDPTTGEDQMIEKIVLQIDAGNL
jgi:hypothetical protein